MKIHYLEHAASVGPGSLVEWAEKNGHSLIPVRMHAEYTLPEVSEVEQLVVLGGPMNIYEENTYPFLKDSKKLIKACIEAGKKIMGICLGGQLISDALGAKVHKNDHKEIGWWETQVRPGGVFIDFPPLPVLFHWHGDVFELPHGATQWASTGISSHQAYTVGENILAMQFHPEVNEEVLRVFLEEDSKAACAECSDGPYAQSAAEIQTQAADYLAENKTLFFALLNRFFGPAEEHYNNKLV